MLEIEIRVGVGQTHPTAQIGVIVARAFEFEPL